MLSYFVATYTTDTGNWGLAFGGAVRSCLPLTATLLLYAVYNRMVGVERMRLG